jgi:methionine-rich copper-binding protein CopC
MGRHTAADDNARDAGNDEGVHAPWPYIWIGTTMRSLRTVRLVAVVVAALMIGALPLGISRAGTVSTGVVTSYPKANDIVDGSMVQIALGFEVPVDHERSTLTLRSGQGDRQLRPRLESAPNYLFSIVAGLAPGAYELVWEARLAGGQIRTGTIPFTVNSSQASASGEHVSRVERERHQAPGSSRPAAAPVKGPEVGQIARHSIGRMPASLRVNGEVPRMAAQPQPTLMPASPIVFRR